MIEHGLQIDQIHADECSSSLVIYKICDDQFNLCYPCSQNFVLWKMLASI